MCCSSVDTTVLHYSCQYELELRDIVFFLNKEASQQHSAVTMDNPDLLQQSIQSAATKLQIETVRDKQEEALLQYLRNRDVFVSLETGGGKSLIFQAAPLCWDFLKSKREPQVQNVRQLSLAIVISPITALIEDQISSLTKKNIAAIHLHRPADDEKDSDKWESQAFKLSNGEVSVLYASPETLATKCCRDLLTTRNVRENICGIFVDESHCIYKW